MLAHNILWVVPAAMGELYTSHIPEMGKDYGTAHLDGSKMADENTGQRHRELFERYCRQKFHDGGRGCSKTVSSKKRENIIKFLSKKDVPGASAHFRFWVKNRGFQMVDMDGKSVLCLPNKQRVSCTREKATIGAFGGTSVIQRVDRKTATA